jgi:hypothetical protein
LGVPVLPVKAWSDISLTQKSQDRKLESRYALEQLTKLAKDVMIEEFVVMMVEIFGYDLPPHTYKKLYEALRSDSIPNPKHIVVDALGGKGGYDNRAREIFVSASLADAAANAVKNGNETDEAPWELLAVLLHEFGHHIDNVLRQDLADKDENGESTAAPDAPREEGDRYLLALLDVTAGDATPFATYRAPDFNGELKVLHANAREAILRAREKDGELSHQYPEDGVVEYFSPGDGDHPDHEHGYGHEKIERNALGEAGFRGHELAQIYFGNWLRDFSQLLIPRFTLKSLEKENLGLGMPRRAWTNIIDILSIDHFYEWRSNPEFAAGFKVTENRLGVSRAVEHIDNPISFNPVPEDPTERDKAFEPWVRKGDPVLDVDSGKAMKRYIQKSVDYMMREFDQAMRFRYVPGTEKIDPEALIHFGAGLHVLEDYFAHSNFVELALRRYLLNAPPGSEEKALPLPLPWTVRHQCATSWIQGAEFPIVTGSFDTFDMFVSAAPLFDKLVFDQKELAEICKERNLSPKEKIILTLLNESGADALHAIAKNFLYLRNVVSDVKTRVKCSIPGYKRLQEIQAYVSNLPKKAGSAFLALFVNSSVDRKQTCNGNPNEDASIDPTHSQLGKDHDDHPLHELAAIMAERAVQDVGEVMLAYWLRKDTLFTPQQAAKRYFCHPNDEQGCHFDKIEGKSWVDRSIEKWMKMGEWQSKVRKSASYSLIVEECNRQQSARELASWNDKAVSPYWHQQAGENFTELYAQAENLYPYLEKT